MFQLRADMVRRAVVVATAVFPFAVVVTVAQPASAEAGSASPDAGPLVPVAISPDVREQEPDRPAAATKLYFRAGAGIERSSSARFLDKNCSIREGMEPEDFAALYGCGTGWDGHPHNSRGNFGTMRAFELGIGYVAAPFLRMEVGLLDRQPRASTGRRPRIGAVAPRVGLRSEEQSSGRCRVPGLPMWWRPPLSILPMAR